MADITEVEYIWKNGEMIPWAEATTHILSHSLHYGSGVFEGIRCYQNPENGKSHVFRLRDHMERLHRSCKIACIELPYTVDELCDATVELIRKNNLPSCYIRPLVYRGYGVMGVDPTGSPTDVAIAVWPWESYLGADALENGVAVGVSSWRQRSNNAIPPAVKSTASYMNSILAKLEAKEHGYAETMFGRRRHIPELRSGNAVQRGFGERTAMNHPMQGSAADIIKLAMTEVQRRLMAGGFEAKLLLQVHDELDFSVPEAEIEPVSALVKDVMEHAAVLRVPLDVDISFGDTWAESH